MMGLELFMPIAQPKPRPLLIIRYGVADYLSGAGSADIDASANAPDVKESDAGLLNRR